MAQPNTPAVRRRRVSGQRFVLIVLAGPVVGILVYLAAVLALDPPDDFAREALPVAVLALFLGWPVGAIPALIAAIAWRLLPQPGGIWSRTGLAALVGALAGLAGAAGAIVLFDLRFPPPFVYPVIAASGAIALVATAIPLSARSKD
ncbi:hypothetical protein [Pelagibacterium halotolerans]|uniref:hypothetical protein n=1 Tax=Pelagibacterium halotolerans TaxID=531813 RepID=UPI00384B9291